ncbi:hypothetical protein F4859DRAFT_487987 [Xylaria cf. heliscus]|nr:hypothetical protein F4859DRAFT_487987 [Xylaria cf. heliscus]
MPKVTPVNDRIGIIVMTVLFTILIISVVVLRFYARHLTKAGHGPDDWLAVAALFFTLVLNGVFLAATIEGAITGHSPVENFLPVPIPLEIRAQIYKYPFQIDEKLVFGLVKLSILFLWKRLFGGPFKRFRVMCWALIVFTILWTAAFFFTTIFQCGTNWQLNWAHIEIFLTKCIKSLDVLTVFAVTDILSDFIIISMPIPLIWSLHLPIKKRVALTSVFLVGFFTIGAGIARTYMYLVTSYNQMENPDFIADYTLCILWSEIEANVAMIVCCLPTFGPILKKVDQVGSSILSSKWFPLYAEDESRGVSTGDMELSERRKKGSRLSSDKQRLWDDGLGTVATTAGYSQESDPPINNGIIARTDISTTFETKDQSHTV